MNSQNQYLLYMGFALLAIAINIIFQIITKEILLLLLYDFAVNMFSVGNTSFEYWFLIVLATGTLSGFIFKFIVDKFIVFGETAETLTKEETGKQLSLYFSFAILTTAIFWGMELLFKIYFEGDLYLIGGIIGLAIGYTLKFLLDRKFVFQQR